MGPGRLLLRAVSKDVPEGIVVVGLANIIVVDIVVVVVVINDDSQNGGITGVEVRGIDPASASGVRRGGGRSSGGSSRPACSLRIVLVPVPGLGHGHGLGHGLVRYHHLHPLLGAPSRFLPPALPFALQELALVLAAVVIAGDQAQIEQEADRGAVQQAPLEQAEDVDREGAGGRVVQAAHLRQQHEEEDLPLGVGGRRDGGGIDIGIIIIIIIVVGGIAEVEAGAAAGGNVLPGAAGRRVGHPPAPPPLLAFLSRGPTRTLERTPRTKATACMYYVVPQGHAIGT